jgi:hypothetical protein
LVSSNSALNSICTEEKKTPKDRRMIKSSPIDLGPATIDLASMEACNTGDLKGSHCVISGRAAIRI